MRRPEDDLVRSSGGEHFLALDQVRAFAIYLVIVWHFTHGFYGIPVPFEYVPAIFPFALLDEGHAGVALFMALSGYIFARLLEGKRVHYLRFLTNRGLRLLPLLFLVFGVSAMQHYYAGGNMPEYWWRIVLGVIYPTLPNGGWSIAVEFHFYIILPLLLWCFRHSPGFAAVVLVAAVSHRAAYFLLNGEVQSLAYWTIFGRIDQFVLGIVACSMRHKLKGKHALVALVTTASLFAYWVFDWRGGYYLQPSYPSSSPVWIFFPVFEGAVFAVVIAWYETSFAPRNTGISGFIGRIGSYSYSIYLLHFFVVFAVANYVHTQIVDLSNFYLACAASALFLLAAYPVGYLSFRFIEAPFLKFRVPYILPPQTAGHTPAAIAKAESPG